MMIRLLYSMALLYLFDDGKIGNDLDYENFVVRREGERIWRSIWVMGLGSMGMMEVEVQTEDIWVEEVEVYIHGLLGMGVDDLGIVILEVCGVVMKMYGEVKLEA